MARPPPRPGARPLGRPPRGTRDDTRRDLLDAALGLFARQGYAATTVRQIAGQVGISDSAIYAHFGAKQELLEALMDEAGPGLLDRLGFDLANLAEDPPARVLPPYCARLVAAWDTARARQLMSLLTREGLTGHADLVGAVQDRLVAPFERWAATGHLRDDLPAERLAWELAAPLIAVRVIYLTARASPAERRRGRSYAESHVRFFLDGARGHLS